MAIAPHPVAGHHEFDTMPLAPAFEIVICIDEIPSQSFLLQTKQAQLSESLLTEEMLQAPHHLCGFFWTPSSSSSSFFCWGAQNWTQYSIFIWNTAINLYLEYENIS